jgi:hypothetical protein
VINLNDVLPEDAAYSALEKGHEYAVAPVVLPIQVFFSTVEKAFGFLAEEDADKVRHETVRILKASRETKETCPELRGDLSEPCEPMSTSLSALTTRLTRRFSSTPDTANKSLLPLGASTARRLPKDLTEAVVRRTTLLLKKSSLPEGVIEMLRPKGERPPRLYELSKIQKKGIPFRPVVSTSGAPTVWSSI